MQASTTGPTVSETEPKRSVQEVGDALKRHGQDIAAETKEKVQRAAAERKEVAASYLRDVADAVRSATGRLDEQGHTRTAQYVAIAADELKRIGEDLPGRDVGEVLRQVERFARERPAVFLSALFVAGFSVARFLKSSPATREAEQSSVQAAEI